MNQKIENISRYQIARFLPDAIARALGSYQKFYENGIEVDNQKGNAKKFSEFHGACKVAIAHLELLLKLARWADLPDADAPDHNQQILLATMMQEAEGQISAYRTQKSDSEYAIDEESEVDE